MIAYEIPPIYTMGNGGRLRFAAVIRFSFWAGVLFVKLKNRETPCFFYGLVL